jgi:hypothetical protein
MSEVAKKPRDRTSPITWAISGVIVLAAIGGGIWAYYTVGPGRTVDTSRIEPGMRLAQVEEILGPPDEVVEAGNEAGWRYGRTHVWFAGVPGVGSMVSEVTIGPRDPNAVPAERPKGKGGPGVPFPKGGGKWKDRSKGPPEPEQPKDGGKDKGPAEGEQPKDGGKGK